MDVNVDSWLALAILLVICAVYITVKYLNYKEEKDYYNNHSEHTNNENMFIILNDYIIRKSSIKDMYYDEESNIVTITRINDKQEEYSNISWDVYDDVKNLLIKK